VFLVKRKRPISCRS